MTVSPPAVRRRLLLALATALLGVSRAARALDRYPSRPVTLVVPFAAGTVVDTYARLLVEPLAQRLGQPVVVDNVPGAGGSIGVERVARAAADGHSLVLAGDAALVVSPALLPSMPYDSLRDLAPVSQLFANPTVLVVPTTLPVREVADLVELARARPGTLAFASAGSGTSSHRAGQLLSRQAGIELIHVPYSASPLVDVIAGRISLFFAPLTALAHVREGRLRALAVTSRRRVKAAPDLPTMIEAGYPDFEASAWFGLLAPAGTPAAVIARLHAEAAAIAQSPAVRVRIEALGGNVIGSSPSQFRELLAAELLRWSQVFRPTR